MALQFRPGNWTMPFPEHYFWSQVTSTVLHTASWGGSNIWEVQQLIKRLEGHLGDEKAWEREWAALAEGAVARAEAADGQGHARTAALGFLRAAHYAFMAERLLPHGAPRKLALYRQVLDWFQRAMHTLVPGFARVDVPCEGTTLPAYFYPPAPPANSPHRTVVLFDGLDGCKETMSLWAAFELRQRGLAVLAIDGPGQGEAVRLQELPYRHDWEVPTRAARDYCLARGDVDRERVGLMGVSLGGYLIPRALAFEHRYRAAASWGGLYDFHAHMVDRLEGLAGGGTVSSSSVDHVVAVLGATDTADMLERARRFTLAGILHQVRTPLFIVHGADDAFVPLHHVERLIAEVGTPDKVLKVIRAEEGGSQHCQIDNLPDGSHAIADWFADRL